MKRWPYRMATLQSEQWRYDRTIVALKAAVTATTACRLTRAVSEGMPRYCRTPGNWYRWRGKGRRPNVFEETCWKNYNWLGQATTNSERRKLIPEVTGDNRPVPVFETSRGWNGIELNVFRYDDDTVIGSIGDERWRAILKSAMKPYSKIMTAIKWRGGLCDGKQTGLCSEPAWRLLWPVRGVVKMEASERAMALLCRTEQLLLNQWR